MELIAAESIADSVERSRLLVGQHICPVCRRSSRTSADPHRTLKQHMRRAVDEHHRLWNTLYWKQVFRRSGERFAPRIKSIRDVEDQIASIYGMPILEMIKKSIQ
jgi:hypothetical protein